MVTIDVGSVPAVAFGLASAVSWGAGDFSGGLATRRAGAHAVVLASQVIGAVVLVGLATAVGEAPPPASRLGWAVLAGAAGALGLLALYRALAAGQMGVGAPVSAVLAPAVPLAAGVFVEGPPTPLQVGGFALALGAVACLAAPERGGGRTGRAVRALALPVASGLCFGCFLVLIRLVGGVYWPLVVARLTALALLGAWAGILGGVRAPAGAALGLAALAGVLDAGGNAFFVLAAEAGRLDVAAVLSSLYPAPTVALAWVVLGERLSPLQAAGVGAALAAIACIAA